MGWKVSIYTLLFVGIAVTQYRPCSSFLLSQHPIQKFRRSRTHHEAFSNGDLQRSIDLHFVQDTAAYFVDENNKNSNRDLDYFSEIESWTYPRSYVVMVLEKALELHKALPTLINVPMPSVPSRINICGDTHGQFFDLMNILSDSVAGQPNSTNVFVFNGDFVDRGVYSFEVAFLLLLYKVADPNTIHLLRGNHECTSMNEFGGFADQVRAKYDDGVLDLFRQVFQALPLCAVVGRDEGRENSEGGLFVTHGGIGQCTSEMSLADINRIDRFREPFEERDASSTPGIDRNSMSTVPLSELLWCDPIPDTDPPSAPSPDFSINLPRGLGMGFSWGHGATQRFLQRNKLQLIVRSHQCCDTGIRLDHSNKCVTVFSAPNYVDLAGNLGGIVQLTRGQTENDRTINLVQFEAVLHPKKRVF